jgi:hypothetical protein
MRVLSPFFPCPFSCKDDVTKVSASVRCETTKAPVNTVVACNATFNAIVRASTAKLYLTPNAWQSDLVAFALPAGPEATFFTFTVNSSVAQQVQVGPTDFVVAFVGKELPIPLTFMKSLTVPFLSFFLASFLVSYAFLYAQ